MNMTLDEAIKLLDVKTRKEELVKYDNISDACESATELVLSALRDTGVWIFEEICSKNLEGKDDEIVVIEIDTLKEIIHDILGVNINDLEQRDKSSNVDSRTD